MGDGSDSTLRFTWTELSGGLGDLGTFLPLVVAMAATCGMDLGVIFIFAGLMNVASGWLFRQPIPVQPMKAIAAVAIAEGLTASQVATAGIAMGVAVTTLAVVGLVGWIDRAIPRPVVRGIQAGVGIKLAWKGVTWMAELPAVALDGLLTGVVVALLVLLLSRRRWPLVLFVFVAGFLLVALADPGAYRNLALGLPQVRLVVPEAGDWTVGILNGAVPQLPLTLLNSVIAVCALSGDYFPGRGVPPRRMAASVGLMNLTCVPFGGMPMCHGAGGLAAQHHFGARTGGSVIMLGLLKVAAGLLLGSALMPALEVYPRSILAVLIIFAGFTLARAARDALRGTSLLIVVLTAACIVLSNTLNGFLLGSLAAGVIALAKSGTTRAGGH